MQTRASTAIRATTDYLEAHPEEFTELFNTILINVTASSATRDVGVHRARRHPALLQLRQGDASIRVWSAGCASGEEAYRLAMLLAEALGPDEFRERVKIYATDVDEEALAQAPRTPCTTTRRCERSRPAARASTSSASASRCVFRKDLRRTVIFGRHDLIQDAPISRIDLLVCRNTLMYFNAERRRGSWRGSTSRCASGGFLFLGKAEMLLSHSASFTPSI